MNTKYDWTALVIVLGLCATSCSHETEPSKDTAHAETKAEASIVARNDAGESVVHLDKEAITRLGIETAPLTAVTRQDEVIAFGRVVENPDATSIVRSPIAGYVRAENGVVWPTVGAALAANVRLASVEPRLSAVEHTDISARLATARGDFESSTAALESAESALKRARTLNANDKNVSDRAVEEAAARVRSESVRRDAANSTIAILEDLLKPDATSKAALPITTVRDGEVVEVLVKPGDFIDAGAPIVRTQSLAEILVRVELPFDSAALVSTVNTTTAVRLVSFASAARTFEAHVRGPDPRVDAAMQRRALQLSITKPESTTAAAWGALAPRPGESMKALFAKSAAPIAGFEAPAESVLHHAGKSWVWIQSDDSEFTRKRVDLVEGQRTAFSSAAWAKDAHVVVKGAQALLSTEIFAREPDAAGDEE